MDKAQRLDEIACVTDLNLLKYFKPHKGFSIKQEGLDNNSAEEWRFGFLDESESDTKTGKHFSLDFGCRQSDGGVKEF